MLVVVSAGLPDSTAQEPSAPSMPEILAAAAGPGTPITGARLADAMQRRHLGLDRGREEHYNLASALQKSLRGWLSRSFRPAGQSRWNYEIKV